MKERGHSHRAQKIEHKKQRQQQKQQQQQEKQVGNKAIE